MSLPLSPAKRTRLQRRHRRRCQVVFVITSDFDQTLVWLHLCRQQTWQQQKPQVSMGTNRRMLVAWRTDARDLYLFYFYFSWRGFFCFFLCQRLSVGTVSVSEWFPRPKCRVCILMCSMCDLWPVRAELIQTWCVTPFAVVDFRSTKASWRWSSKKAEIIIIIQN